MRDPRIRKYNKKFEYSYAMGTFPTIDLLKSLPNIVMKVLINPLGERDPQVLEVISLCKEQNVRYEFSKELIEKIKNTGVIDFDVAVATPEIMKDMATIAKILGPKGLMPSPKNETVSKNIKKTVEELKKGKITFKNDETCNLHQFIGKVSWPIEKIKENYEVFLEAVKKAKPSGVKGAYIKQIVLCSTMGPGVKIMV